MPARSITVGNDIAFDLSPMMVADRELKRFWHSYMLLFGGVSGGLAVFVLIEALLHAWREIQTAGFVLLSEQLAGAAVLGFFSAYFASQIIPTSPGASRLSVGDDAVRLIYGNGREQVLDWRDPRLRFALIDFGDFPLGISVTYRHMLVPGNGHFVFAAQSPQTILTPEAFNGILGALNGTNVRVDTRRESSFRWRGLSRPLVYRISGAGADGRLAK